MFDTSNHANLATWSDSYMLSVCTGSHTTAELLRGAQQETTCSNGDVVSTGTVVSAFVSRRRRDVDSEMVTYSHDMYRRHDLIGELDVAEDSEYHGHVIVKVLLD